MALALVEGAAKSSTTTLALFCKGSQNWAARRASSHWARLTIRLVSVRSRVFMLSDASMRMAISGVRLRWRCWTYSGRSRVKTSSVTNKKRRHSSRPTARPRALRCQLAKLSQPA